MNKHAPVILDEHSAGFVDRQVEEGKFASRDEVVRAGLELLEARQAQVERLRAAIIEGEESGETQSFDFEDFIKRMHARVAG